MHLLCTAVWNRINENEHEIKAIIIVSSMEINEKSLHIHPHTHTSTHGAVYIHTESESVYEIDQKNSSLSVYWLWNKQQKRRKYTVVTRIYEVLVWSLSHDRISKCVTREQNVNEWRFDVLFNDTDSIKISAAQKPLWLVPLRLLQLAAHINRVMEMKKKTIKILYSNLSDIVT